MVADGIKILQTKNSLRRRRRAPSSLPCRQKHPYLFREAFYLLRRWGRPAPGPSVACGITGRSYRERPQTPQSVPLVVT